MNYNSWRQRTSAGSWRAGQLGAALLMVALAGGQARAQTLKELLQAAQQENLDARLAAENRARVQAEFDQAWGGLLPSLSAQGAYAYNQFPAQIPGREVIPESRAFSIANTVDPQTLASLVNSPQASDVSVRVVPAIPATDPIVIVPQNALTGQLRVDLPLIAAAQWFRVAAQAASNEGAQRREQVARDAVSRAVISTYYGMVASQALLESARRSLAVAQAQLELQQVRRSSGVATELEEMRARAEVDRNRQIIADTEANLANVRRTLRTATGLEAQQVDALPSDDLHPEEALDGLESRTDENPQVKAAQADLDGAGHNGTAAAMALVPTVGFQFTQQFTNAPGFANANALFNTGLVAQWRLDAPTIQATRIASSARAAQALTLEKTRRQVRDQIHSDWQRVKAALIKVVAAQAQVESASRAAALAKDRSTAGVATQLDVIQAERDLFSANVANISARTDLAIARLSLKLSAGLPLEP